MLRAYHQEQEQTLHKVNEELITTERSISANFNLTWTTLRILERSTSAMMPIFVIKAIQTVFQRIAH